MGFSDALGKFDDADEPSAGFDAFDAADGTTHIPAGWYACTVHRGEATTTKSSGKPCYRLVLDVAEGPHAGTRLWRYYVLDSLPNANRAKAALAPLGLTTGADLRAPFPPFAKVVRVRVLIGVQDRPGFGKSNDVERLELVGIDDAPTDPDAVNPADYIPIPPAQPEGGSPK